MKQAITIIIGIIILGAIGATLYFGGVFAPTDEEPAASVEREETLTCADGTDIHTQYLENEHVIVELAGTPYELAPVRAASGARYANSDESFVFWNKGTESMILVDGDVVHEQCRTDDAQGERTTTDPIVNGYALSFIVPEGATVSQEADVFYKVLYAGPNNESPALTDGFTVTMTLEEKAQSTPFREFVETARAALRTPGDGAIATSTFYGRDGYSFEREIELGNVVTEQYVHVDDTTVARVTVSMVGENAISYRSMVDSLLESLTFQQIEDTADDRTDTDVSDQIVLESVSEGDVIESPLTLSGEARGTWYFEASFSAVLTDWDGRIIAETPVTADDEWMTEDFVPFSAEFTFESPYSSGDPEHMKRGSLILQKANPSGLPENAAALEIPVRFAE